MQLCNTDKEPTWRLSASAVVITN